MGIAFTAGLAPAMPVEPVTASQVVLRPLLPPRDIRPRSTGGLLLLYKICQRLHLEQPVLHQRGAILDALLSSLNKGPTLLGTESDID